MKVWSVDIDTADPALAHAMHAILVTDSLLTHSMIFGRVGVMLGHGRAAFLRVQIPEGRDVEFRNIAQPIWMRPPPLEVLGIVEAAGHPGRPR